MPIIIKAAGLMFDVRCEKEDRIWKDAEEVGDKIMGSGGWGKYLVGENYVIRSLLPVCTRTLAHTHHCILSSEQLALRRIKHQLGFSGSVSRQHHESSMFRNGLEAQLEVDFNNTTTIHNQGVTPMLIYAFLKVYQKNEQLPKQLPIASSKAGTNQPAHVVVERGSSVKHLNTAIARYITHV